MDIAAEFSHRTRAVNLRLLNDEEHDLLIIGGGITGAGVARDAVLRGLSVGLVERRDFAAGTSSRSSKLIHGGLRYLQQGDVGLVREAATERYVVRQMAPHLARPCQMMVPVSSRGGYAKIKLGLWTFDRIARVAEAEQYRMIGKAEALEIEPSLLPDRLYGAGLYYEYTTDDARLVIETLKAAARHGAVLANYAEVTDFVYEAGRVRGVKVRDAIGGADFVARAKVVINACGPWVDHVRLQCERGEKPRLRLTKGIHLVLPRRRLPVSRLVVMNARDKRGVFAVPKGAVTYLGTTDTDYDRPDDYPDITYADAEYLLDAAGRTFAGGAPTCDEVVGAWAGLRPLVQQEGKKPSEISRKDEIMVGNSGLLSIAGGKLTTFRRMAERIVDLAMEQLTESDAAARQGAPGGALQEPLSGGETGLDIEAYTESLARQYGGVEAAIVNRLVELYGSNARPIVEAIAADAAMAEHPAGGLPITRAEVEYAVRAEMAMSLEDVLERRSRLLLWDLENGVAAAPAVAGWMGRLLGWEQARVAGEIRRYGALVQELRAFRSPSREAEEPRAISA